MIESALVIPMKKTTALMTPLYRWTYGFIRKPWFAKLQAKTLNVPDDLFENYFNDSSRMTKESLINMTKSNGNYSIPCALEDANTKALILVGEKELGVMKKSAFLLNKTIKSSTLKVIKNSGHGEISMINYKAYVKLLDQFFKTSKPTK